MNQETLNECINALDNNARNFRWYGYIASVTGVFIGGMLEIKGYPDTALIAVGSGISYGAFAYSIASSTSREAETYRAEFLRNDISEQPEGEQA